MTVYKAPEKEFSFILQELVNYKEHCRMPGFEAAPPEMVDTIIPEAARFFEEVVAPTNQESDVQGSILEEEGVRTPAILDGVYSQLMEAGWGSLNGDPNYGGAGFPGVIDLIAQEMLQSANLSFSLLPLLSRGVVHALSLYGSEDQKKTYLEKLITGTWSGTMNLTEPQAGSDLAAVQTKAVPEGDHYLLSGQKIYITWGDHSYTENIVHLVLARTPNAPEGVKGISLFIVPKYLMNEDGSLGERNDVKAVSLEHKMGIHASPTCVMVYGDQGGAVGYLVGEENHGLVYMFAMMNAARLAVGHQGVAVSERAYQQAVDYAKQRVQGQVSGIEGRAPIIYHPDVKRMLMQMRALTEAGRALSFKAIAEDDRSYHHPDNKQGAISAMAVEVLTPLVKGWCTEIGMEVTSLGIQVHGGMGFVEETGAAQHMRDARILPIYEGTNGIQALDFVGRKTLRDGGQAVKALVAEMKTIADSIEDERLSLIKNSLTQAIDQCEQGLAYILENPSEAEAAAFNYLMLFGNSACGSLLAQSAVSAQRIIDEGSDDRFYVQKIATATFFATQILPRNEAYLAALKDGSGQISSLGEEDFNRE